MQHLIKLSVATATTLALTACGGGGGGGDDTTTSTREQRPLGSPGYFVPEGQNSITINLSSCSSSPVASATMRASVAPTAPAAPAASITQSVTDATLTVYANGDVVLSGTVGSANSASELLRINQSTPAIRRVGYDSQNVNTRSGMVMSVDYYLSVDAGNDEIDASTNNTSSLTLSAIAGGTTSYSCTVPRAAFSMPDTISNARLAKLVDGVSLVTASQLYIGDQLTLDNPSTPTMATWHTANGETHDDLATADADFINARYVRFDWSGTGGAQGARFLTSASANGTFAAQDMPPRVTDTNNANVAFEGAYEEMADNQVGRRDPLVRLKASTHYEPSSSLTSYKVQVERIGQSTGAIAQPVPTLSTAPFTYTGAMGQATGMPNFLFDRASDIALSNCTGGVQRAVRFKGAGDERVLWMDGNGQVLHAFTPGDLQRREILLTGNGTAFDLTYTLKQYASSFDYSNTVGSGSFESERLSITTGTNSFIEVKYRPAGASNDTVESCSAPAFLANSMQQDVTSRYQSLINFGSATSIESSPFTIPYSPGGGTWTHRINNTGILETRIGPLNPPGNTGGTFQVWTGGANWLLTSGAHYRETYNVNGSLDNFAIELRHPTVENGSSQAAWGINLTPVNGGPNASFRPNPAF